MNRNQKIALGCGGLGCLGLIVLAIVGIAAWTYIGRSAPTNRNRNYNFNVNTNTNSNQNDDSNSASDSDADNNSNSTSSSSSSSYSEDDKHKLFQAAGMIQDAALFQRVMKKIGLFDANSSPTPEYETFVKEHFTWALKNTQFILSVNTKEKAQAYLDEHLD
jgi:hypothetical protein